MSNQRVTCKICQKSYSNKYNLKEHIKIHIGDKNFSCDVCDYKSYTKKSVEIHKRKHFPPTFKCDVCDKKFKHEISLYRHLKVHKVQHKCDFCCYETNDPLKLTKHRNTHVFVCEICGVKIDNFYYFKMHLKNHQKRDNDFMKTIISMAENFRK
jgi:KRAB domain-containing zinc finger protein